MVSGPRRAPQTGVPSRCASMPAAMISSASVEWPTPRALFDQLDREFGFTLDPSATPENAKCARFFTRDDDGLSQPWAPAIVFCNPPYGSRETGRWVAKARQEADRGAVVVLLIPVRTDTRWWHDHIEGRAEVRFLKGRVRFDGAKSSAPFPSAVVVFRETDSRNACGVCGGRKHGSRDARFCSSACRQRAYRRRIRERA